MFHVVLIHACNMRKMHGHHAFHMHGHIASGRVWVQGKVYSSVLVSGSCAREKWDKVQGRDSRECK